jgi:diguanylate cyclase (GGDEF)-like protein
VGIFSDLSEVKNQQHRIERNAAEEYAIGQLLELSLQGYSLESFLQRALEMLLGSVSWLNLEQQGGIFLAHETEQGPVLRLIANHNLPAGVAVTCQEVPFGTCLCGRAATEKTVQFAGCVDERHEIDYPDMAPHGHYSVPILSGEDLLGVMVLYLPHGHERDENEVAFLGRVADVFSTGITRRRADAEVQHLAYRDRLTGLPNRLLLEDHLAQVLAACRQHGHQAALLYLDLDRFKNLNDAIGHPTGDLLLQQVAERLSTEVRAEDTVARVGGDEFVVLLPQLSHDPQQAGRQARALAQKVHETLSRPYDLAGYEYRLTLSIGISLFSANTSSTEDIIRQAEIALNRAKDEGRNAIRFYRPEMQATVEARMELESDLRQALERDELELYYQPQVNQAGQVVGAEALLRWRHPEWGMVSPGEFIPVAEETGLILPMGEWVLASAAAQRKAWAAAWPGPDVHYIAINVSPRQFHQADYVEQVEQILARTGIPPEWIKLEITESVVLADVEDTIAKMEALKARGLSLAIDDFGTGYSSLSYLRRLPLDQLKIDRSFLQNVADDPEDAAIVEMIIQMSHRLGIEVVAEGVETDEQFAFLKAHGCGLYQGFHFYRPMSVDQFEMLLRSS